MNADVQALEWAIAILVTVIAACIGHLYKITSDIEGRLQTRFDDQLTGIRMSIDQVKTAALENRIIVSDTMVTKREFDKQVDRLVIELERRVPLHRERGSS